MREKVILLDASELLALANLAEIAQVWKVRSIGRQLQ